MSETKTKYRVGFVLHHAQCANCNYSYRDRDSDRFYELKEDVFSAVEQSHDEMNEIWKFGCEKRELQIRFGNAVREIV